jgi:hypothetical protein
LRKTLCTAWTSSLTRAGRRDAVLGPIVQFRSPQRFIRINVSDATDQGLIQECSLYFGVFCAKPAAKSLSVKSRIERVSRNMRYRGRHARIVTSVTCGVRITGIDEIIESP